MFMFRAAGLCLALLASPTVLAATYDLIIEQKSIVADGRTVPVMAINGQVPGPELRWREGESVTIKVTNRLPEPTSLHWHGLLLPGAMDGVPGLNGYNAIAPGATFTYHFPIRQAGTYWYHSHSGGQEQLGIYGAIVITPAKGETVKAERDYVVMLSDLTAESPQRILRNLKVDAGYYNRGHRTVGDFFQDVARRGLGATLDDRWDWGMMRMEPTDLADVSGYAHLINGQTAAANWTGLFKAGEKVRLRFINGSAMSFYDVSIPGLKLIVTAADGQPVQPVPVDEFRIGVAETYDVIVTPAADKAYTILVEPLDRDGYARGTLAPRAGMTGAMPTLRRRTLLTMADMGMAHGGHAMMGHDGASAAGSHVMPDGTVMANDAMGEAKMDHSAHAGHAMAPPVSDDAPPLGWVDADTPPGNRMLAYADLKAATIQPDQRPPRREIEVRLGGNMQRYIWTLNGQTTEKARPIELNYGERVRLKFINETMMAHPMHLHGMFVQLENGQAKERLPNKHVVVVPPGQSYSVLLTADEPGEWSFHCHLLYHMSSGMMTKLVVARLSADKKGGRP